MTDPVYVVEVVLNRCSGGFALSDAAAREIARRKRVELREAEGFLFVGDDLFAATLRRDDPDLVDVVREMGAEASGAAADLRVCEVAVEVSVENSFGLEDAHVAGHVVHGPPAGAADVAAALRLRHVVRTEGLTHDHLYRAVKALRLQALAETDRYDRQCQLDAADTIERVYRRDQA